MNKQVISELMSAIDTLKNLPKNDKVEKAIVVDMVRCRLLDCVAELEKEDEV